MVNIEQVKKISYLLGCLSISACTTTGQVDQKVEIPVEDRSVPVEKQVIQKQIPVDESPSPESEITTETKPDTTKQEKQIYTDESQVNSPVIVALLDDVNQFEHSGKLDQAAATLERALRIEPKNPLLWQRLSAVHLRQENWQQAIAMAQKSNALAANNTKLQLTNWRIIARASKVLGDTDRLIQARKMIQSLSN